MDRWREKNGEVFSIPKDNPTVPGCTISKSVFAGEENNLIYFSLAEDWDLTTLPALLNASGKLELSRAGLIVYSHGEYYSLGKLLGTFGYSVRKKKRR